MNEEDVRNLTGLLVGHGDAGPIQRARDLLCVNNVAGWAKERLRILADTCDPHETHVHNDNIPPWVCRKIREICAKMETVAEIEIARTKGGK